MKEPGLRTVIDGKPKSLYMQMLKEHTKPNLKKTIEGKVPQTIVE